MCDCTRVFFVCMCLYGLVCARACLYALRVALRLYVFVGWCLPLYALACVCMCVFVLVRMFV